MFLLATFLGPELREAPDASIQSAVGPLFARLLGSQASPALLEVARHPQGIPPVRPRASFVHRALRARLARVDGPLLAGYGCDGVAFGAAAASGIAAARRVLRVR